MDLEELIKMSQQQPTQPDLQDLELTASTHMSRLQSPSPDIVSASFRELAFVAKFKPELVQPAIPQAVYIISTQPASAAACGAFNLLSEMLISQPTKVLELKEILNLACEAARVQAAAKQLKQDALGFICRMFDTEQFKEAVKRSVTHVFFNPQYCLAKFCIGCLSTRESLDLIKQLLQIYAATDYFTSPENTSYETSFVDSLVKSGVFQQIFGLIEKEKCSSEICADLLDFTQVLLQIGCDVITKGTIRESFYRYIELLADFIHSAAYYYLTALAYSQSNHLQALILQKALQILTLICTKSDEKNTHEKAQNFARDSKIFNYLVMLICGVNDQYLEENLEITSQSMQILQRLIHGNEKAQIKLCTTIINNQYSYPIDVFYRLAYLAISHYSQKIYKYSLQLLTEIFGAKTLSISFSASLSKPIRSAARGNVSNGLKLIFGSFTGGIERSRLKYKAEKSILSAFMKQCGEQYKHEVANIAPPDIDICANGAIILVQEAMSGSPRSYEICILLNSILYYEQAAMHFAIASFALDVNTVLQNPHIENLASTILLKFTDSNLTDKRSIILIASTLSIGLGENFWNYALSGLLGLEDQFIQAFAYIKEHVEDELCACMISQLSPTFAVLLGKQLGFDPSQLYKYARQTLAQVTDESVYDKLFAWLQGTAFQLLESRLSGIAAAEQRLQSEYSQSQRSTPSVFYYLLPLSQTYATVPLSKYQELKSRCDALEQENATLKAQLSAFSAGVVGAPLAEASYQTPIAYKADPIALETTSSAIPIADLPGFAPSDGLEITQSSYPSHGSQGTRRRYKMMNYSGLIEQKQTVPLLQPPAVPVPQSQPASQPLSDASGGQVLASQPKEQTPEQFFD